MGNFVGTRTRPDGSTRLDQLGTAHCVRTTPGGSTCLDNLYDWPGQNDHDVTDTENQYSYTGHDVTENMSNRSNNPGHQYLHDGKHEVHEGYLDEESQRLKQQRLGDGEHDIEPPEQPPEKPGVGSAYPGQKHYRFVKIRDLGNSGVPNHHLSC